LQVALLAVPIAACWLVVRNTAAALQFSATYLGVLLFAQLWHFIGELRHFGILFLAFVGAVWTCRAAPQRARRVSWLWVAILAINAAGGLRTLSIQPEGYSRGRAVAQWLQGHGLSDAFIIASPDSRASTVAGYLMRPIYYLGCECNGTFMRWNLPGRTQLSGAEVVRRTQRVIESSGQTHAILLVGSELNAEEEQGVPNLVFELQTRFVGAQKVESYFVYQVRPR
jgi:hypothetical protein